jgi:hypothetical protein
MIYTQSWHYGIFHNHLGFYGGYPQTHNQIVVNILLGESYGRFTDVSEVAPDKECLRIRRSNSTVLDFQQSFLLNATL